MAYGVGKLKENPTTGSMEHNSTGFARACWAEEPTTGEEFLCVLVHVILKEKIGTVWGENWPIGYDDIKPYYDKVDKLIGVFGSKENLPNEPDGFFLPLLNRVYTSFCISKEPRNRM